MAKTYRIAGNGRHRYSSRIIIGTTREFSTKRVGNQTTNQTQHCATKPHVPRQHHCPGHCVRQPSTLQPYRDRSHWCQGNNTCSCRQRVSGSPLAAQEKPSRLCVVSFSKLKLRNKAWSLRSKAHLLCNALAFVASLDFSLVASLVFAHVMSVLLPFLPAFRKYGCLDSNRRFVSFVDFQCGLRWM